MLNHEEMWEQRLGVWRETQEGTWRERQACRCLCLCTWMAWGVSVMGETGVCVCGEKGGVLGRYGCAREEGETWWGVCVCVCVCVETGMGLGVQRVGVFGRRDVYLRG